jgi:hypothetical protein
MDGFGEGDVVRVKGQQERGESGDLEIKDRSQYEEGQNDAQGNDEDDGYQFDAQAFDEGHAIVIGIKEHRHPTRQPGQPHRDHAGVRRLVGFRPLAGQEGVEEGPGTAVPQGRRANEVDGARSKGNEEERDREEPAQPPGEAAGAIEVAGATGV